MNITASKFNSRVKTIVSGLFILCILVNAILWFNGISYTYIYQRLYPSLEGSIIHQTNLPVHIDPVHRLPSAKEVAGVQVKPRVTRPTTKTTMTTTPARTTPTKRPVRYPWPPFNIPKGVKIRQVKISVTESAPLCKVENVGPIFVPWGMNDLTDEVKTRYEKPAAGGLWAPKNCRAIDKVAVLVPYRDRPQNLELFSHHMHYFLQKQQLDYGLFIIEQADRKKFNRAKLFNVGFIITQLMHSYNCIVLHDIDKIPEDTSYSYACPKHPKHLPALFRKASDGRERKNYFTSHYYKGFFGGVSSLRTEHYIKINGMINDYWGWGGEDDELYSRLTIKGYRVDFANEKNAKYVILYHKPDAVYSHRPMPKNRVVRRAMPKNGLNSVKFELVDIKYEPLYTRILVKL